MASRTGLLHGTDDRPFHAPRRQAGYAALVLVVIIGLTLAALFVTSLNAAALHNEQNRKTLNALALAKQALIARAATDQSLPGSLPCPDTDNNGSADLFAGNNCPSYIGRLPWRTLGLPDLRDASGERLWYALSPNFRDYVGIVAINDSTAGTLSVTGVAPVANVAAIVFSPGSALPGQARDSAANQLDPDNYLESTNATGGPAFTSQAASDSFNDQLITIAVADLMPMVEQRVAREMMTILQNYKTATGGLYYPWAADNTGNSINPSGHQGHDRGLFPCGNALPVSWGSAGITLPGWLTADCGSGGWASLTYYAASYSYLSGGAGACDTADGYCNTPCGWPFKLSLDGNCSPILVLLTPGTNGVFENSNGSSDSFTTPTSTANDRDRIYTYP
ncbi:MAG TPA: hypothetical protein VMT94_02895 [Burkholderiales bacterium]|nr:hypothetical protein [Burkholderiales bacterium]